MGLDSVNLNQPTAPELDAIRELLRAIVEKRPQPQLTTALAALDAAAQRRQAGQARAPQPGRPA